MFALYAFVGRYCSIVFNMFFSTYEESIDNRFSGPYLFRKPGLTVYLQVMRTARINRNLIYCTSGV